MDLHHILEHAEAYKESEKTTGIQITDKERKVALAFLKNAKLIDIILSDFEKIGVVGEQTNKLVGYLAAVSRKLPEPLSILIQSRSAAGKSTLQDAILKLVPDEDVMKYTRITDQALFYSRENAFSNKILAIEEGPGMKGAAYSIRNIQSSGKITIAAAGKTSGNDGLYTKEYTVNGPVSVMVTTTATTLDEETASRFIVLTIDESAEMTQAIHAHHRASEHLNGLVSKRCRKNIISKHHNAQRLLESILVINPYARYLTYPTGSLKTRRDFKKYLSLIKALAFLHQYQRNRKQNKIDGKLVDYIEVDLNDIDEANRLAVSVLGHSLDDLPAPSRRLLKRIISLVKSLSADRNVPIAKVSFTRRMIREYTGWSNWQVRNYLPPIVDLEYICLNKGIRSNQYSYVVNIGDHHYAEKWKGMKLTTVSEIKEMIREDNQTDLK
jgi:hypothetical protein